MDWFKQQFSALAGTRWLVVAGLIAAAGVFVASLLGGVKLVPAFFLALAANGTVVGLAGVSRLVWKGAEVSSAPVPGTGGLDVNATKTIQTGLGDLNKRVDAHIETVNQRLYDLEKRVFKNASDGNETKE